MNSLDKHSAFDWVVPSIGKRLGECTLADLRKAKDQMENDIAKLEEKEMKRIMRFYCRKKKELKTMKKIKSADKEILEGNEK